MFDSQSSQEFYSQPLIRINNPPNIDAVSTTGSDYWSQPSSQEDNLCSYAKRPLLFTRREKPVVAGRDKSMQFHDMQQHRLAEMSQKMLLSTVESLTNRQTSEMKDSLDTLKSHVLCELQKSVDEVKTTVNDNDGFNKILITLEDFKSHVGSVEHLKVELQKKAAEIDVRNETIRHLEDQLNHTKEELKVSSDKNFATRNKQADKLDQLLERNQSVFTILEELKENGKEFKINTNHLLKESMSISEQSGLLLNKENIHYGELAGIKRQVDDLSRTLPELCRNLEVLRQFNYQNHQKTPGAYGVAVSSELHSSSHQNKNHHFNIQRSSSLSSTGLYQQQPISFLSPKPFQNRFSNVDAYVRPSPTAIVAPRVVEKVITVKDEFESQPVYPVQMRTRPLITDNDIFEVSSSDSESCHDMVVNPIRNNNSNNKNNNKYTSQPNHVKQPLSKKQKKQSRKSPKPRNDQTKDISSKPSTPVQRSIKRYCKIKKSVNPFAAMLPSKNVSSNDLDRSKALLIRPSRCSLAMKRKQENVFNFDGDDDELIQFADLLKSKCQKRSVQMPSQ